MGDYRKLTNQPLVFALAEFRFSPVLQIEQYIPELQEALRRTYPVPESMKEQSVQIQPGGISVSALDRWVFLTADRRQAIAIDQQRLIYFTTDYPRFEGFSSSCIEALEHLKRLVDPSLILRIGLRYGDLVKIGPEEHLDDYVDPYFGFPACAKALGSPKHQKDEVTVETDIGSLLIRSVYGYHNLVCMPDLSGLPVVPTADAEPSERIILDFDHFWTGEQSSTAFEIDFIRDTMTQLHSTAREAFWTVTTDKARDEKWSS